MTEAGEATELGLALAALVADGNHVPREDAMEIHQALAHRLAAPPAQARRHDQLWLLMAMIMRTGEIPRYDAYELQRNATEKQVASGSALIRAHGSWLLACEAAVKLLHNAPGTKVRENPHRPRVAAYGADEALDAIETFQRTYGHWPWSREYVTWQRAAYRAARLGGHPPPRNPNPRRINQLFGSFDRAVQLAQKRAEDREHHWDQERES